MTWQHVPARSMWMKGGKMWTERMDYGKGDGMLAEVVMVHIAP